jgi:hypothetical protein
MNMPKFTAKDSLYTMSKYYQATEAGNWNGSTIYPAQILELLNPRKSFSIDFFSQIREPQCVNICLGGYCRWICF